MWNEGLLTKEDLAIYAKEYYHFAKRIPGIVERVKVRAIEARPDMVTIIEENRDEEAEHAELWARFAKSLGVSRDQLEEYVPTKTVQNAVSELEALADGSFEEGAACMYALELDLPAIARTKKDGLCKHYDLPENNADAHQYFDEHLLEEEHLEVWRKVAVSDAVAPVISKALDMQHKILDGVCEAAGIECECEAVA